MRRRGRAAAAASGGGGAAAQQRRAHPAADYTMLRRAAARARAAATRVCGRRRSAAAVVLEAPERVGARFLIASNIASTVYAGVCTLRLRYGSSSAETSNRRGTETAPERGLQFTVHGERGTFFPFRLLSTFNIQKAFNRFQHPQS